MKSISIKGYKAINNEKHISLTPINLIIGPNGSGKSTVIKSLLLSKEMLKKETEDLGNLNSLLHNKNRKEKEYDASDFYYESKYNLSFSRRLLNPFERIGKFSKKDVNLNSDQSEISFSLPVSMRHFYDSFTIKVSYHIDVNNNALLSGLSLNNETRKTCLFSSEIIKRENNGFCKSRIKIDVDYLLEFADKIKNVFKKESRAKKTDAPNENDYEIDIEDNQQAIEEAKDDDENFRLKFSTPFSDQDNCSLSEKKENHDPYNLNLGIEYSKVANLDFYRYEKEEHEGDFNIKEDEALYNLALQFEGKWLEMLKTGYEYSTECADYSSISINSFLKSYTLNFPIFPNEQTDWHKLSLFNIKFFPSAKWDFIFHRILFNNLHDSLKDLNKEIMDVVYVPPNRNNNYRAQSLSTGNEDINTTLINMLNNMRYADKWIKPAEFYVRYWLNEFQLSRRVSFNNIDDMIAILDPIAESNKKGIGDLGYGMSQLIPLICLFSLFNEKYSVSATDPLISDWHLPTHDTGYCYLIEEPEANLHPNFQSKLADLIIDAAWKFRHQFVIETHSEYLVRKFQFWIAKGKIRPEDVNLFYFENQNENQEIKDILIKKIKINKDGSLSEPFGPGFFDEADKIALEILLLNRNQRN